MASRTFRWMVAGSTVVLFGGGYFIYSLMAAQGQGTLAQAPLNIEVQTPPAFVMALDDSGSMVWETLNNTRDGVYHWIDGRGFYNGSTPYGYDQPKNATSLRYYYLTPPYGRGNSAIPPLDAFGFARSPDINGAYFDPRDDYPAWKTGSSDPAKMDYMTIDPTAAPVDPRPSGSSGTTSLVRNLTTTETRLQNDWKFSLRSGMVLPKGTVIQRYNFVCTTNPSIDDRNTTVDGSWRRLDRDFTVTRECDASFQYFAPTFFLVDKRTLPAAYGYTADPVAVTDPVGGRPGTLYKYEIRPENFSGTNEYKAAINNFARWFSFYRTRREALIGAATNALQPATNLRVGWFRINDRTQAKMYDMSAESEKMSLLADITLKMRASSSTPNRRAVDFLGQQFQRTKSSTDPSPPVLLSCQKNAGMLFTDGYINDDYTAKSMTALALPYYEESLVSGLEKYSVPVPSECNGSNPDPSLDCKTNLHMNFYGVTLGTLGNLYGVTYVPDPKKPWLVSPDPYKNPPKWSSAIENLTPNAVDEMWRATLETRGEMMNATRPGEITAAMRRIIENVSAGATPSGTQSLTGARIGTGSLTVEPFYEATNNSTDWYSRLTAYSLKVDATTRKVVSTRAWEASEKLPAASSRNILYWKNGNAVDFSDSNVSLADLCSKPTGLYGNMAYCATSEITDLAGSSSAAIAYLRGDTSREKRNGGKLRDRTTVLGDIINSGPVLSSPTDDYGYRTLPGILGTTYTAYLQAKRNQRRYMVYAGGNDGMLHGFDGGMTADGVQDSDGGKEVFAYIPSTAIGHMGNLLLPHDPSKQNNQRFQHRYYMDGPVVVGDTYNGSAWQTSLVATAGAGGRSVFALNVSTPGAFAAGSLMWEISDLNSNLDVSVRDNIGHVLGKPVIVPLKDSSGAVSWKAIFGNGYDSKSKKAVLFVVDMQRAVGASSPGIRMITAEETGTSLPAGSNGLGNVVVVDRWGGAGQSSRVRDGFADTAYAADQRGAVWKFDLRGTAKPARPVFTTATSVDSADRLTYRQPITGGLTATAGPSGGVMLLFGTGSFWFAGDQLDKAVQGLYGVNDVSDADPATTLTPANLRRYAVTSTSAGVRQLAADTPPANARGWRVELPAGERAVGYPTVASGIVFIPTYVPAASEQSCSVGGANWLYGLSSNSGEPALSQVRQGATKPVAGTAAVSLATGGSAPVRDVNLSIIPRLAPPGQGKPGDPPPTPPGDVCLMQISVAGAEPMYLPYPCGRQSWRQIQ